MTAHGADRDSHPTTTPVTAARTTAAHGIDHVNAGDNDTMAGSGWQQLSDDNALLHTSIKHTATTSPASEAHPQSPAKTTNYTGLLPPFVM